MFLTHIVVLYVLLFVTIHLGFSLDNINNIDILDNIYNDLVLCWILHCICEYICSHSIPWASFFEYLNYAFKAENTFLY